MNWLIAILLLCLGGCLWGLGSANRDEVIGLLEQMLAVGLLLVVLFIGHQILLEILFLAIAIWLPKARSGLSLSLPPANRDDVLIPF
uniref:Uncharacterized protein n=1 Tax=Paulinella chromatophora TaxID=39717 RepID=B1X3K5_PAUCH|nr:hypothetical protein PCC_0067 [Paulinella chromatophora]ACB42524.1 hypothetical protein PCC_0067 [Paulinella chromatophora]